MESRINYTLVGFFMLLLTAAAVIIPLWLSSGLNQQEYKIYEIDMNEAVDGLSLNAPVNYNGVNVGYVKSIELNAQNTEQVKILVNIKQDTPITTNTTAALLSQGVTGFTLIGLSGGSNHGSKPLTATSGQRYPIIKSTPSIRLRLDIALSQLMNTVNTISHQLNGILSSENGQLLHNILNNTNQLTLNLTKQTQQLETTLSVFNQSLPSTMNQLQGILNNTQMITQEIKQNPSVLIRGKGKPLLGPGENE